MTTAIYEPRGPAGEYSPLACNLYRGCAHGCLYCYAPGCLRMRREEFDRPSARRDILAAVGHDAAALAGDRRPVLLCFTSDPYQPLEEQTGLTRRAIDIMGRNRLLIRVLTKRPGLAIARDLDVLIRHRVEFGVSLVWADDGPRQQWEPGAGSVDERLASLRAGRDAGLRTWVSMEPVIDPEQALRCLDLIAGTVDVIKVGKINHSAALSAAVDWTEFTRRATALMVGRGQPYYVKDDLWAACCGADVGEKSWALSGATT